MKLIVQNHLTYVKSKTPNEEKWLIKLLSFPDGKTGFVKRGGHLKRVKPKMIRMYKIMSGSFPTGYLNHVVQEAQKINMTCSVEYDLHQVHQPNMSADLGWLRDYQVEAVNRVTEKKRGILWHPTGAGKTETAIGLTRRLPVKWMFFVNQKDLMHQAADRYEKRTGIKAGLLGDGIVRSPEGNFTVATFQTLAAKKDHPKIIKILEQVEGVIVDEAHTLPADSFFETIMKTKNAYYRVGMSGTPLARGDKRSIMTVGALGPVIHRIKPETLIERGLLSRPTVRMVRCYQESQKPTWQGVSTELICNSVKRNNIVADIVSKKAEYPCLVFVDKVKHGKELLKRIQKKGVNAEFVWGDKNTPQRQAAIERLVRTDTDVLICSTIFQTGVDIPEVKEIVVACGGKSAIATIQRVGRAMRVSEGKRSCVVWDFADTGNKWLEKHAKLRQKAYTDEGYETIVDKEMSA